MKLIMYVQARSWSAVCVLVDRRSGEGVVVAVADVVVVLECGWLRGCVCACECA